MEEDIKLEGRSLLHLLHYRQKYNWDCGVSCVLMILPEELRREFLLNFEKVCAEEKFLKSTWTIDLCYLLKRFQMKHTFCTITLGVQPGYTGEAFYSKILSQDKSRVNQRFSEAASEGLKVIKCSLTHEDLAKHLTTSGPVILLIDSNLLHCELCKSNRLSSELRQCLPWTSPYQGHYIVLCGYDINKKIFFYRNPTYRDRVCAISFNSLNEARFSFGTDEDAILLFSPHLERSTNFTIQIS